MILAFTVVGALLLGVLIGFRLFFWATEFKCPECGRPGGHEVWCHSYPITKDFDFKSNVKSLICPKCASYQGWDGERCVACG